MATAKKRAKTKSKVQAMKAIKQRPCGPFPGRTPAQRKALAAQICARRRCKLDTHELCLFLTELSLWLEDFMKDYTGLRCSHCNTTREAFKEELSIAGGDLAKIWCVTGPVDPPGPPPPPPTWD